MMAGRVRVSFSQRRATKSCQKPALTIRISQINSTTQEPQTERPLHNAAAYAINERPGQKIARDTFENANHFRSEQYFTVNDTYRHTTHEERNIQRFKTHRSGLRGFAHTRMGDDNVHRYGTLTMRESVATPNVTTPSRAGR